VDIVEFLRARLDEDEDIGGLHARVGGEIGISSRPCDPRSGERIVADAIAKRRILALHGESGYGAEMESDEGGYGWDDALSHVFRLLALPYSDHPDYRQEWKP
jgi:hypothetical protein